VILLHAYRHIASCTVTAAMALSSGLGGTWMFLGLAGIMLWMAIRRLGLWFATVTAMALALSALY
jgi:hypothetical protein